MPAWLNLISDASLKAAPAAITGVILLALGWLVTARVTAFWDDRKKERELSLAALERFYELYGEFFAVWKVWEALLPRTGIITADKTKERMDLLQRAAAVEGSYESLIVKLTVERDLSDEDVKNLAYFREGLQCLRESIERNLRLRSRYGTGDEWRSGTKPENPQRAKAYRSFKTLAVLVSDIAVHSKPMKRNRHGGQLFWRTKAARLMTATNSQVRGSWWLQGLHDPDGVPSEVPPQHRRQEGLDIGAESNSGAAPLE